MIEPRQGRRRGHTRARRSTDCRRAGRPRRCRRRGRADGRSSGGRRAVSRTRRARARREADGRRRWRRPTRCSRSRPASGATLAVGHTERFNPAVQAALPILRTPRFIEVHRLSGFPERSLDIDVVFDVMIHDLDIILAIDRTEVVSVDAVGVPVLTPKDRHRQRAREVRVRLRRQHHRQPHQPGQGPQGPLLPAGHVRVGGLRRAGAGGVAARPAAGRAPRDRGRAGSRSSATSRSAASWRTSSRRFATGTAAAGHGRGRPPGAGARATRGWLTAIAMRRNPMCL